MSVEIIIVASIISLAVSFFGTLSLVKILAQKNIFDKPNERSNHVSPTPRGGGIAIIGGILVAYLYMLLQCNSDGCYPVYAFLSFIIGVFFLATISWIDDVKTISAKWRLLAQIIIVSISVYILGAYGLVFSICIIIAWVWFINLYNFMDGIDGITGSETISISIGLFIIFYMDQNISNISVYPAIIGFSSIGFLFFNITPAKIFMGDVGSITLGYIIGLMLIIMATKGHFIESLILPMYYIADSTITITKRLFSGKKIWEAHSEHFYQQAVRAGKSHSWVVKKILQVNVILMIIATYTTLHKEYELVALFLASCIVATLLYIFASLKKAR